MDLGLYVDARVDIAGIARAAEAASFSTLWVYDSPLLFADATVACVLALEATTAIAVGPGVANPLQRPALATAQMAATLDALAPGRVVVGLGRGNSARLSLGMAPARVDTLIEHARITAALLRGDTVEHVEGAHRALLHFVHPSPPWIRVGGDVPIWISAFGPRTRKEAAAVADGILVRWQGAEDLERVRGEIADGAVDAGRNRGDVKVGVVTAVYPVHDDAELDTPAVRAALGPLVVSRLRYLTAHASSAADVPEAFREGFVEYRAHQRTLAPEHAHLENYRGYLVSVPPELERFVTPASMRAVATIGTPPQVAAELTRMVDAGTDHISLQMAGDLVAFCRRMASNVMPLLG